MGRISEIKKQLRHKDWEAMFSECQTSGKKVEEWCAENGIKVSTYYKRLYVLRTELIEGNEKQSIVPVSISASSRMLIVLSQRMLRDRVKVR